MRPRSWREDRSGPNGPPVSEVTDPLRPADDVLAAAMLLAVCIQLGLRIECRAKALKRAKQRVDLVERVLARCLRVELEPERDLVRAVGDPQADARLRGPAPPLAKRRVLDEHAHVGAAVEAGQ